MSTIKIKKKEECFGAEPLSIRFLRSCLNGNPPENIESDMERYLIEYGLTTTLREITNRGKVFLESYPNKSLVVLLLSEEKFTWLKGDPNFVLFDGQRVLLITNNKEARDHALFLTDLGIAKQDDGGRFFVCDRYTLNFLKRFERSHNGEALIYTDGREPTAIVYNYGTYVGGNVQGSLTQISDIQDSTVNMAQDHSEIN